MIFFQFLNFSFQSKLWSSPSAPTQTVQSLVNLNDFAEKSYKSSITKTNHSLNTFPTFHLIPFFCQNVFYFLLLFILRILLFLSSTSSVFEMRCHVIFCDCFSILISEAPRTQNRFLKVFWAWKIYGVLVTSSRIFFSSIFFFHGKHRGGG